MESITAICPTCGYSLHGLTEWRCPECGSPFTSETLKQPMGALPWDRTDKSFFSRFFSTLLLAWFKPHRYFAAAAQNPARPISKPRQFIIACVLITVLICACGSLVDRVVLATKLIMKGASAQRATYSGFRAIPLDTGLITGTYLALDVTGHIVAITAIMWLFRRRSSGTTITHVATLLMPMLPLLSLLQQAGFILVTLETSFVAPAAYGSYYFGWLFLLINTWLCCRRLLQFPKLRTSVIIILSFALYYFAFSPALAGLHSALMLAYLRAKGVLP